MITKSGSRALPRLQLQHHLLGRNQLLAFEVPAALRRHLILEQDARGPGPLELLHVHDVVQIAVSGVAVGDDGIATRWAMRRTASAISVMSRPTSGKPEHAGRGSEAADEDGFEPGQLDEPGGEDVMPRLRMTPGCRNKSRKRWVGGIVMDCGGIRKNSDVADRPSGILANSAVPGGRRRRAHCQIPGATAPCETPSSADRR